MSFNHEAVAALQVLTAADKALIRAMATRRFAYSLAASESATNFVAVDPDTGVVPLYLIQNSTMFAYDSTDSTTVHDGVTCLVSFEGKRFKNGTITPPYSVLSRTTSAQPGSPAVGDRYLIPTAATGAAWAGQDGKIGIYTAAGWQFAVSPIGRFLYIESETAFYHRNPSGTWVAGVGSIALGAGSVSLSNVLGANASLVIKVENQTTNTPPASPVTPTAYIIGPAPTGAWAGNAGRLAICLAAGAFTIITPVAGDVVYDKALASSYGYNGSAWVSALGAWKAVTASALITAAITTATGAGNYTYSDTTPPDTAKLHSTDSGTAFSYTAGKTGALLRVTYCAERGLIDYVIALHLDSNSNATDWCFTPAITTAAGGTKGNLQHSFYVTAPDALAHTYTIMLYELGAGTRSISRRRLIIEEAA